MTSNSSADRPRLAKGGNSSRCTLIICSGAPASLAFAGR